MPTVTTEQDAPTPLLPEHWLGEMLVHTAHVMLSIVQRA